MRQGYTTKIRVGSLRWLLPGLILCLLTFFYTAIYARNDQHTITLNLQNASLEKVFKEIEKQTQYSFLYMQAVLKGAKNVNVKVANASLEKVLEMCFKEQDGLTWSVMDKVVVIKPALREIAEKNDMAKDPITVSGRVTDQTGKPLVGANVKIRNTNTGVVTDFDGRFTLASIDDNVVLEISYVGYEVQVVSVKGQRILAVNLVKKESVLDESVVIAYGTTTKRLATGSIGKVSAREIANQPVSNPLLALQGRVPGLFIEQATGVSGSGVKVRIQGEISLSNGSEPLYIIDGVPYVSSNILSSLSGIQGNSGSLVNGVLTGNGNPLSFINPLDIESIEILRDADATAIYGSRAAAGAILITTKKGKSGQTKLDLNVQRGWSHVPKFIQLLNTQQYLEMRTEAKKNDGESIMSTDFDINGIWDQSRYTDWQKELIGGTAEFSDAQFSVSGGSNSTTFLIGAGYHKETTVFPGDLYNKKTSLHFNINNVSANQRFRIQLDGKYLEDNNRLISTDLTDIALQLAPNAPELVGIDGTINWAQTDGISTWTNPLSTIVGKYHIRVSNLISNSLMSYKLLPGLEIKSSFGYSILRKDELSTGPLTSVAPEFRPTSSGSSAFLNGLVCSWIIEPQAVYTQRMGNGTFDMLIGSTFLENENNQSGITGFGYNNDLLLEDIRSAPNLFVLGTSASKYRYNALFSRLNYNYENKVIVNLTARRDGSSRFGVESRFNNFAAIGTAWIFSSESFIKDHVPFLSFGKLRVSYGSTGNDQIGDYRFMNLYDSRSRPTAYQGVTGLAPRGLQNSYLQWEETRKFQLGLDLGFWNDRILINTNYYDNRSSNQLQGYALPMMTGFSSIDVNLPAKIRNYGWEIMAHSNPIKNKRINWNSQFNLTLPSNKLIAYDNLDKSSSASRYVIGEPVSMLRVFNFLTVDPVTGLYQFLDKDGNITTKPNFSDDETFIINLAPKFYGGFQNSVSYCNFVLDFLFQYVKQIAADYHFGNRPGSFYSSGAFNIVRGNQPISVLDRWQKAGDLSNIQKFSSSYPSTISVPASRVRNSNARYVDASYIRLKNVSFSWQANGQFLKRLHLQNARIFVNGQNLFTITRYKGLDPETKSTISLPPLRVLTIGIQLTL